MSEIPNYPTVHCHPLSLDSGSTPESFAEREVELGTGTITCTDHGSLAASRRIYDLGHENGLIPVLGCLMPGQEIHTIDGCKNIEDLKVGDLVLTHKGRFRPVTRTMSRQYEGEVLTLFEGRNGARGLTVTPDHPVFICGQDKLPIFKRSDEIKAGNSNKWGGVLNLRDRYNSYVMVPRVMGKNKVIRMDRYLSKYGFTFGGNKNKGFFVRRGAHFWKFCKTIELTKDWAYFLGLFAAEGSAQENGSINLTFNIKEKNFVNFTVKFLSTLGIIAVEYERPDHGASEVVACNVPIALLLRELCGVGANNKKVPREIIQSRGARFKKAFLDGLLDGDGHKGKDNTLKVTSRNLSWGARLLAISLGSSTIPRMHPIYGENDSIAYSLHIQKYAKWRRSFWVNGGGAKAHTFVGNTGGGGGKWRATGLKEIKKSHYSGMVYNVEVSEDNSYVSDFILHNCELYIRDDNCKILEANGYQKNANGAFIGAPKYLHLTTHFLDQEAYETGVRLLSKADLNLEATLEKLEPSDRKHGQERKPLFTWQDIEELGSKNVIFTSSCMIGIFKRHLFDNNDMKTAIAYFEKVKALAKPGNFYVEVNPHDVSKNWTKGIFFTMSDGQKLQFYDGKKLMTNVGEITAEKLAKDFKKSDHRTIKAVKNRSTWEELPEREIIKAEDIEDFLVNECKPWCPDGDYETGLNRAVTIMAKRYKVPVVIGGDEHYARSSDKPVQDVRLMQSGNWRFFGDYSRRTSADAFAHFQRTIGTTENEFRSWVTNAQEWAQRFKDFKFETPISLPTKFFEIEYEKRDWYKEPAPTNSLRYLNELIKKHGRMDWNNPVYVERLKTEIKLLHDNGTIDLLPYFFTMEEACEIYSKAGELTGPSRGSAAGVLISYLLSITHVDPIRYNLSLERFITLDRIASGALPDIDQDLGNRNLLMPWLNERFPDHWAQISADVKIKLKSAVRDVARATRKSVDGDIEGFAKKFLMPPQGVDDYDFIMGYDNDEGHIQGSVEYDPELKQYIKRYPQDWEIVQKCLGLARGRTRHASAILISGKPVSDFIPLTTVGGVRVTAYTATSVEAVGGVKFDFLNINSLNDISSAMKLIKKRSGIDVPQDLKLNNRLVPPHRLVPLNGQFYDIWDLPEDQAVFKDISLGHTETVFQLSTPGAVKWLRHFSDRKPNGNYGIDSIEAIAAFTALDRPGTLDVNVTNPDTGNKHNILVEYARRSRGCTPTDDILPIFNELLPETHGLMIFQEQNQFMYQKLVGCTLAEAEEFRRDVAKKKLQKLEKSYLPFIERAGAKIGVENAKAVWEFFIAFGKYSFNLSHSISYAIIAYACAYLKHYYPLEWWTSVLKNADKNEVNENFWRYCGHLIDLPDVKLSGPTFEIQGERIRAPLDLLKGVGEGAHKQIEQYKPYEDILSFCRKMEQHKIDTGTVQEVTKTRKDKTDKYINAEGKKVSRDVEYKVMQLKKGGSAINRGVVQKLIISGAMDSLFPAGLHLGEKLVAYEQALADAQNEINIKMSQDSGGTKKVKVIKPEPVDASLWDVGVLTRFQMRKQILPAIGVDLRPLIQNQYSVGNISSAHDLVQFQNDMDNVGQISVIAYIDLTEPRKFVDKKSGETKEMCKVVFDVESAKFEYVRWSDRNGKVPDMFKENLVGAVAIITLDRYKSGKSLAIKDFNILEKPLEEKESKEDAPEAPSDSV